MPPRPHSSNASASCRLEWRPSRWLTACLVALTPLSIFAVSRSEAPGWLALALSISALLYGIACVRRELLRPPLRLFFRGDGKVLVDGVEVDDFRVAWRGPVAFLDWKDARGHRRRLAWWPDALPADARRRLRLASAGRAICRLDDSVRR